MAQMGLERLTRGGETLTLNSRARVLQEQELAVSGRNWGAAAVEGLSVRPLLPPWAWLVLIAGFAIAAWLTEAGRLGRRRRA